MTKLPVPEHFGSWLRSSWKRLAIPPIAIGLPAVLTSLGKLRVLDGSVWLTPILVSLQLLTIIALLLFFPHPLVDRTRSPRATVGAEQFSHWWRLLWLFWLFEYVILLGRAIYNAGFHPPMDDWVVALGSTVVNLGNNLPTVGLIMCYYITTAKTVREIEGAVAPRRLPWEKAVAALILLTVAELLVRLNFTLPLKPHPISGIPATAPEMFTYISGIAAGLATALLVGRLDSRFITLSPFVVTLLYGYAVIQTSWPSFGESPMAGIIIVNIALALKILLFAVVYWLFRSGVFLYYLERVAEVFEQGPTERKEFLDRVQSNLRAA